MQIIPLCFDGTWWTEAHAAWAEAFALVLIFILDLLLARLALEERKEARHERTEANKERIELRRERQELQEDRQRIEAEKQLSGLGCVGVKHIATNLPREIFCGTVWKQFANQQPGFAIEREVHMKFPRYLELACGSAYSEIQNAPQLTPKATWRPFVIFKFPHPHFDLVLQYVQRDFGEQLLAWDENGKPITVSRT